MVGHKSLIACPDVLKGGVPTESAVMLASAEGAGKQERNFQHQCNLIVPSITVAIR